jgi:hypothetical protein
MSLRFDLLRLQLACGPITRLIWVSRSPSSRTRSAKACGRPTTGARKPSPLLKADGGTLAFSANAGSLRVRYGGWDEAKVLAPGESLELVARNGQVWAFRRGEPLRGPAPDPYKDWDGGADLPSGTSPYKKMCAPARAAALSSASVAWALVSHPMVA